MGNWELASSCGILINGDPSGDGEFHAGHLNDVLRLDESPFATILVAGETSGVWLINQNGGIAFPLSDSWAQPDLNSLARGVDGTRHVYAGGFALYETDVTHFAPLFNWRQIPIIDADKKSLDFGSIIDIVVIRDSRKLILACWNGVFWAHIPKPGGTYYFKKAALLPEGAYSGAAEGLGNTVIVAAWGSDNISHFGLFYGHFFHEDLQFSRASIFGNVNAAMMLRTSIDSCMSDKSVLYAVAGGYYKDKDGNVINDTIYRVLKSINGGKSWTVTGNKVINNSDPIFGNPSKNLPGNRQDWNNCIAVSPISSGWVVIGWRNGYFTSIDSGNTWTFITADKPHLHSGLHTVAFDQFDATQQTIYIGSDGGLATTKDLGNSHTSMANRQLPNLQFYRLAASYQNAGLLAGSLQDNGDAFCILYPWPSLWKGLEGGYPYPSPWKGLEGGLPYPNPLRGLESGFPYPSPWKGLEGGYPYPSPWKGLEGGLPYPNPWRGLESGLPYPSPWKGLEGGDGSAVCFIRNGRLLHYNNIPTLNGIEFGNRVRDARWNQGSLAFVDAQYFPKQPLSRGVIPVDGTQDGLPHPVLGIVNDPIWKNEKGEPMIALGGKDDKLYGLFLSTSGAVHWTLLGNIPAQVVNGKQIEHVLAVGSSDGNSVFIGTDTGRIFKLTAPRWGNVNMTVANNTAGIQRFVVQSDINAFAIASGQILFKLTDTSWAKISGPSSASGDYTAIETDWIVKPKRVFLSTDNRVYSSLDEGRTWTTISTALPENPHCRDLRFVIEPSGSHFLYLATYGRSVFRLLLNDTNASNREVTLSGRMDLVDRLAFGHDIWAHAEFSNNASIGPLHPVEDIEITEEDDDELRVTLSLQLQWFIDNSVDVAYTIKLISKDEGNRINDQKSALFKLAAGASKVVTQDLVGNEFWPDRAHVQFTVTNS